MAQAQLEREGIAFLHQEVETAKEDASGGLGDPARVQGEREVGVDACDAPGDDHGLVHGKLVDARREPVEVREVEAIEIGEDHLPGQMLLGNGHGGLATHRQAHHADALRPQALLLLAGERVLVAIGDDFAVLVWWQDVHDGAEPGAFLDEQRSRRDAVLPHAG